MTCLPRRCYKVKDSGGFSKFSTIPAKPDIRTTTVKAFLVTIGRFRKSIVSPPQCVFFWTTRPPTNSMIKTMPTRTRTVTLVVCGSSKVLEICSNSIKCDPSSPNKPTIVVGICGALRRHTFQITHNSCRNMGTITACFRLVNPFFYRFFRFFGNRGFKTWQNRKFYVE